MCVCVLLLHTDAISARMTQKAPATDAMGLYKSRVPEIPLLKVYEIYGYKGNKKFY